LTLFECLVVIIEKSLISCLLLLGKFLFKSF
jgi:hypothetical protein